MSDYGVTDKGFQMRRLDEIYADICKRFKDEVGVDPSENPQSVMNVLFTIFADAPAELWEAYAAAYQQLFPNTACGVALDNVMQVGGVSRIGQAKTKYFISCTGQEGTVIPVGALIQSSSRPQRTFRAVSASIISSANWRKLAIRPIESIAGTFTFDFGVSRNATSGEVGTYAESSSITKKMTVSSYDDAYSQMLAAVQSFDALGKFGIAISDETDDQGEHSTRLKRGRTSLRGTCPFSSLCPLLDVFMQRLSVRCIPAITSFFPALPELAALSVHARRIPQTRLLGMRAKAMIAPICA